MKFGVFGTGMVGQTLGSKLIAMGHEVAMGSRTPDNEKARAWVSQSGSRARTGTFRDVARFGEVLLNCTEGAVSLAVLRSVDRQDLAGKLLIDVANPLDFSKGKVPILTICNDDSLGESIQREYPESRVVKALNTCNCRVMVDPALVPGEHDLFLCGNDAKAKEQVKALLREFGWKTIIDLGDITSARATEQLMPIWIRLFGLYGSAEFNFKIVKKVPDAGARGQPT